LCSTCTKHPPREFDSTIAAVDYATPVDQLVLALKFRGRLTLAPLFAEMLRHTMQRHLLAGTGAAALLVILTAVPLSAPRLQQHGFNQALEITKPLARLLKLPLRRDLLRRKRNTLPQSHELDLEYRQASQSTWDIF